MTLTGTKLGRYEILSKIGEGGMGEVYLAQDTTLSRKVAIKFLPIDSTASEQANKRLLREARTAANLDHPNICTVHEVAEENGRSFIVMQYVEGDTLDVRINKKTLEFSDAISFAIQIADALGDAHAHGIIHRDIKSSNVIIDSRGQAKVMDFGLAKFLTETIDNEAETKSLLTTPGTIIGTMPYMSPEQVHGQTLDARTDIFSFGVLLYEMLTSRLPFAEQSAAGIISAILTREPAPLSDYFSTCPQELQSIVSKCLEKDRERRYQSIRDVATDLEKVRSECTGAVSRLRSTGEKREAGSKLTVRDFAGPRTSFLTRRRALAFGTIVLVIALISLYTLFFRGRRNLPVVASNAVNSPAYDYYVRGKVMVASQNRADNETSIRLLEQATKTDPNFAAAWAELASAYTIKMNYYAPGSERKQLNLDAEVAVEKALTLDPNLAEGHYARGLILWTHDNLFPHERAIQSYKRAIALNPNLDDAHEQLGVIYLHIGLLDKGRQEIEKALEIRPSNTMARFRLGVINIYQTRYEDALTIYKSVPRDVMPSLRDRNVATALFQLGRMEEASAVVEEYLKSYPTDEGGTVTSVKAMLLANAGNEKEAEETIQRAIEIGKGYMHFHHTAYNVAVTYALLNKPADAMKWLQFAADDGFPCYPWFENDANLNNLRKDQRFIAFMAKLKQQWEHYQATL
jgi:serine/threonine protein kinase/Flp pilus assembly protein TadD